MQLYHLQLHLRQDRLVLLLQAQLLLATQGYQTNHLKQLLLRNHLDFQLSKHEFHLIDQQRLWLTCLLLQYFLVGYHLEFLSILIQFEGLFHLLLTALYSDTISLEMG
jgi:hypothetical protein